MREQLGLRLEDAPAPRPRARRSYHVRSHQTVEEAQAGERRAARQEAAILDWMRGMADQRPRLAPSEVHEAFRWWPLTSIRRAMTNMAARGVLIHYPADRRPGPYGARESVWGLA